MEKLQEVISNACNESLPECGENVFQPSKIEHCRLTLV